jgi:hypothetical protein
MRLVMHRLTAQGRAFAAEQLGGVAATCCAAQMVASLITNRHDDLAPAPDADRPGRETTMGLPEQGQSQLKVLTMTDFITRSLKLKTGGSDQPITIRISWPAYDKTAWESHWEIDWPDRSGAGSARGIDAVQALMHALQMVGAEIYGSAEHLSGNLVWDEAYDGYGLPVPNSMRDLLLGDDARIL